MIIDSPIISGSFAASGSLNQFGDIVITGSLTVTGNIIGTASFATTASYLSGYVSPFPFTGSAIISGSLEVTGSANIPNITGSLLGTASFANTATSSSFATTASFSLNVPVTSSYANNATSASFATTASYLTGYISPFPYTGSAIISGSLIVTGSVAVSNLSGSGVRYLVTDASGSVTAQTASAAIKQTQAFTSSANQTSFTISDGYVTGLVDVYINGSKLAPGVEFTDTSGTVITLATGSNSGDLVEFVKYFPASGVTNNALRQQTTFIAEAGQTVFSASYTPGLLDIYYNGSRLSNSDYTANNGTYFTLATASAVNDILDVFVYSYQVGAFNGIGGTGVVNQVAFFNTTSSITGSNSFTVSGDTLVGTASYASNADTLDGAHLSILATTGSNIFTSAQYVSNTSAPIGFTDTASVYTDGGIRATKTSYFSSSVYIGGDLIIFGSQSVNYITSSQLNIADNIITVNTSTPALRFGGLAVQDSGSLATGLTGSILWDSQDNQWIYSNPSGSEFDSAVFLVGPRNSGTLGNEVGITTNALAKGDGFHHMTSSGIFEVSGSVGIGLTNPSYKLHVSGAFSSNPGLYVYGTTYGMVGVDRGSSASSAGVNYYTTGSQRWFTGIYENTNNFGFYNALSANFPMVITTGSNVGIGTTSPSYRLDVSGSIKAGSGNSSALLVSATGTASTQAAIAIQQLTSEGDTIIFADFEPFAQYGIVAKNDIDSIDFNAGNTTNSLATYNIINRTGTTVPAYVKTRIDLINGYLFVGGRVGIGTISPGVSLDLGSKTDAVRLTNGTTAQRPTAAAGQLRYNTSLGEIEMNNGSNWGSLQSKVMLGSSPSNPAESANDIKTYYPNATNGFYWIKQTGSTAVSAYCVFKDFTGADIAGGPWTIPIISNDANTNFSTNGTTAASQFLSKCQAIGINTPGRGMESSRTTTEVFGAWLAVKRAIWEAYTPFMANGNTNAGAVLRMPIININGEGGTSDHRTVYNTSNGTHIPNNESGDRCNAGQLFCGWWAATDTSTWRTNNNDVPGPEDWGPADNANTAYNGAGVNSVLTVCVYK